MKPPPLLTIGIFGILIATGYGAEPASVVPGSRADETGNRATPLLDAVRMREELAVRIMEGKVTADEALELLRREATPYGLNLDTSAEFALAAIDVGQRLLGRCRPKEAEPFFRAAETGLVTALSESAVERSDGERVMLLRNRALIRANYLGKAAEAEEDFSEAIRLQPDNKALVRQRDAILGGRDNPNRGQNSN